MSKVLNATDIDWGGARSTTPTETSGSGKESQGTAIVRLAMEARAELWHTPAGDGYITIAVDEHHR